MQIAICDDDKKMQKILAEKVSALCPQAEVVCYSSGKELLMAAAPDILLLDIGMPDMDGMKTAEYLRGKTKRTILIFVTAMRDYVFRAFDVGAFHYLVKPFTDEKFAAVMQSAAEQYRYMAACSDTGAEAGEKKFIMILSGGSHIKVNIDDIVYAEVFNRKVVIHKMYEDIEYYGKLSDLEKLVGEDFFRPHRSFLVHFKYVVRYDGSEIVLERGAVPTAGPVKIPLAAPTKIPLARKNYAAFVRSYMNYNRRMGSGGRI